jgi:hypothetical protein
MHYPFFNSFKKNKNQNKKIQNKIQKKNKKISKKKYTIKFINKEIYILNPMNIINKPFFTK